MTMQFHRLLKGVFRRERDGLARRKDVVGKWEIYRRLRFGEMKRCSPDTFAVWALMAFG